MKIKHSKIKNIGIIFELLASQIAKDILDNKESKAIKIIKEHFKKGTEINKELGLYQTLLNEKYDNEMLSNQFIDAVLAERRKLKNVELKKQKYNLVKEINDAYGYVDFFNGRLINYKMLASVYKLFENCVSTELSNPIEIVKSRNTLIEHIVNKNSNQKNIVNETADFGQQDKTLRILSYKLLLDKFNEKYQFTLNVSQKQLLKEYILSISNTKTLKEYIEKELTSITKTITTYSKKINDKVIQIKLNEIVNQMSEIRKDKKVKEEYLIRMMKYYQLIDELKKNKN